MVNFACMKCGKIHLVIENYWKDFVHLCVYAGTVKVDMYSGDDNEYVIFRSIQSWLGLNASDNYGSWIEWAYENKRSYLNGFNVKKFKQLLPCLRRAKSIAEFKLVCAAYNLNI